MTIFLPESAGPEVDELLSGGDVLGSWTENSQRRRQVTQLLVSAEAAEPIMDRLEESYGDDPDFRVVLLGVEAVLPRPPEPDDTPAATPEDVEKTADRVSREELYHDVTEALGVGRTFVVMTVLSSVVAAVGLVRDDLAVIIGAMVIAPLLGPNVAMSFAATLGDFSLLRRALVTNALGVTLALLISLAAGFMLTINPELPSITARSQVGVADLAIALAAGSAGTFAFTRGLAGAVIGVMVAVALMPPLVTFGLLIASEHTSRALGALLLVTANVICVNLAGVATFLAQGVRPRGWWEEGRAKRSSRAAILIWCALLASLGVVLYLMQVSESRV